MMITRFTSFGTSALTRPIFLFTLVSLTVSIIFTSLILAGGTSETAGLRKFYLVSFKYNPDSAFYKTYEQYGNAKEKLEDTKNKVEEKGKDTIKKINPFDKRADKKDDNKDPSFKVIRVSYRGLCVEHTEGWDCAASSDKLPEQDLEKDPLNLVEIADMYKDKIVWSVPFWITVSSAAIAYIMIILNSLPIPSFTPPFWTKKLAASMLGLSLVSTLGGMVLGDVTTSSVSKLVDKVTMGAIVAHQGKMVVVFGWIVFALVTLCFLGIVAVVVAEWGVLQAQAIVAEKTAHFVDVEGAHEPQNHGERAAAAGFAGFKPTAGGFAAMRGNVAQAATLAQTLRGKK
ncbi:Ca2+ regulator and membrane fusion protein Fig1-domain-containing protein [Peziza echinospora]|nr:Ca2+ regulator and membrane fusion protein Fig1-domain-containing protein [Peziza echinospora]